MVTRTRLSILAGLLDQLHGCALQSGSLECVGLLASPIGRGASPVDAACLLPAESSRGHAEVAPLDLSRAVLELGSAGLKPVGLWHSHGDHAVYHSARDDAAVRTLLPAMAEWNYRPARGAVGVPVVSGADAAALPLRDGRVLRFQLLGLPLPGTAGHERASWRDARVTLGQPRKRPRAVVDGDALRLTAGEVTLVLGVPEGARLLSRVEESGCRRTALLFSLVVNNRRDSYAQVVEIGTAGGQPRVRTGECPVEPVLGGRGTLIVLR